MTATSLRPWLGILIVALANCGQSQGAQQTVVDQQYPLKAAYLLNFGSLITWPKEAFKPTDGKFVIGVLGKDPFGETLQRIERERTVQQPGMAPLKIRVLRFKSMDDYEPCHILFISSSPAAGRERETVRDRLDAAIKKLTETKDAHVLLVSDTQGFARKGVAVNFLVNLNENTINMEINRASEKRAGLTISSRLLGLKIVQIVTEDENRDDAGPD
jgi:hypothetical protein